VDKYTTDLPKDLQPICVPLEVKSPFNRGLVRVAVKKNNERMRQLAGSGRVNQIFEAYYNLCGRVPPVNNIGYHESTPFPDNWGGIRRAHLIFRGLKRPCKNPGVDSEFYTYVTKPRFRYKYTPGMVCTAKRVDVPDGLLFVAVVSYQDDKDLGEILNWEWVEVSERNPDCPTCYDSRYDEEVWKNE
jgi:hypothetical protein